MATDPLQLETTIEQPSDERGLRFGLSDYDFNRWWSTAISAEDGEEFVHLLHGNIEGARFVCAIDVLSVMHDKSVMGNLLVRAYLHAFNIPESDSNNHVHRINAQILYEDPAVQMLLERVRYRNKRASADRLSRKMANRLEKMYAASEDDLLNHELQGTILRNTAHFIGDVARERVAEMIRLEKGAIRAAIERGKSTEKEAGALPTPDEAIRFLTMLREELGPTEFARVLESVQPKQLEG